MVQQQTIWLSQIYLGDVATMSGKLGVELAKHAQCQGKRAIQQFSLADVSLFRYITRSNSAAAKHNQTTGTGSELEYNAKVASRVQVGQIKPPVWRRRH